MQTQTPALLSSPSSPSGDSIVLHPHGAVCSMRADRLWMPHCCDIVRLLWSQCTLLYCLITSQCHVIIWPRHVISQKTQTIKGDLDKTLRMNLSECSQLNSGATGGMSKADKLSRHVRYFRSKRRNVQSIHTKANHHPLCVKNDSIKQQKWNKSRYQKMTSI